MWDSAAEEKANGAKVKLVFDKISIDGVLYAWDTEKRAYQIDQKKK